MGSVHSTGPAPIPRRTLLAGLFGLSACVAPPRPPASQLPVQDGAFLMRDGTRLPFRRWAPSGMPDAVMLALHGFNDSRDAWEVPGPELAAAGIALYGPDQRGFGATPSRGHWAGAATLAGDAASMLADLALRHPGRPVFLLGESMGGAVAMRLAASAPGVAAGFVAATPAVWGRARLNFLLRTPLWLGSHLLPGLAIVDGGPVHVRATDNLAALRRLSRDPLTLHTTRLDTLAGLVDLMDDALAACPGLPPNVLLLYGGRDEVIPPTATRYAWSRLAPAVRTAFYPDLHHLMLRDLGRSLAIGDIVTWVRTPGVRFPTGADRAAALWRTTGA